MNGEYTDNRSIVHVCSRGTLHLLQKQILSRPFWEKREETGAFREYRAKILFTIALWENYWTIILFQKKKTEHALYWTIVKESVKKTQLACWDMLRKSDNRLRLFMDYRFTGMGIQSNSHPIRGSKEAYRKTNNKITNRWEGRLIRRIRTNRFMVVAYIDNGCGLGRGQKEVNFILHFFR